MNNKSYDVYNLLMSHFFNLADQYYQMAHTFKHAGYDGLYYMARNESEERWRLGDKMACYVNEMGKKPIMINIGELVNDWPNPKEALNTVLKKEKGIANILLKESENIELLELDMLSDIYHDLMKDHSEVNGILNKFSQSQSIFEIDTWLYDKYSKIYKDKYQD